VVVAGVIVALGVVAVAALTGRGTDEVGAVGPGTGPAAADRTTTAPDPSPTAAPTTPDAPDGPDTSEPAPSTGAVPPDDPGAGATVTLAFAGDASFEGLGGRLRSDPGSLLADIAPALGDADLSVVNLEAALGTGGTPVDKTFVFQTPPAALDALRSAGVDAVSMANNHGMDHGPDGLAESLEIGRRTGFPLLGVGADEDAAYAPLVREIRGQRVGVIAANDVFDNSLRSQWTAGPGKPGIASAEEDREDRLARAVREARGRVDTLVVFLHYGTEKETCPNARQRDLARLLTDAGADVVVGGHAHRVQGAGFLGDRLVAYGLGNFVFKANSADGAASGVLVVRATGRRIDGYEWRPARISGGIPRPLTGVARDAALATMDQRRACAGLTATPGPATAAGPSTGTR
jgi:poly-gamma-glutamate capsule biosynthesis protein CapA/YwtB (metallophosphatase superfamily)